MLSYLLSVNQSIMLRTLNVVKQGHVARGPQVDFNCIKPTGWTNLNLLYFPDSLEIASLE